MGLFYPQLMRSISPNFNSAPIAPGMLTPYVALFFFGAGVLASNVVWNTIYMRVGGVGYSRLFPRQRQTARHRDSGRLHLDGGAELQRDRLERGGPGDLVRAGTGRDAGRGHLGTRDLARIPRGARRARRSIWP